MAIVEIITWREIEWRTADFVGYDVEATDGSIGKVDETTKDIQSMGFVVVDTGPWIFGKKVMLPAGLVQTVDHDEQKIYVDRTKDEIKNAPEFDKDRFMDETYRSELANYYGSRARAR
jgi:PRC-barrel domain protein